ncbi:hypothetical protein IGI04_014707 [Brassica rapa subsp. trilocularis]|uniref:Uncharacterized protein n=1 Tax=Brassica rapa subsp. trilocularis TaxID=1813537 RepID=A0ABQ7MNM4_BRACM|nr:hypothetical protein IGI04_014707 [Brassica rapa subsp. trilocularis]
MVATLILVRDERGDLHDQEGHLRNVAGDDFWQVVKQEKLQEGDFEVETRHSHPPSPVYVKIDRHSDTSVDRHQETVIGRQPPVPIDRRAPLTYRVQMPKRDFAHLNTLRPKPKPSDNPPETIRIPSDDAADPMEVDRVPMERTLRKRKEKVTSCRRINDLGIIAACHCGAKYEIEYSASIKTHTTTSIDSAHQKSTEISYYPSIDTGVDRVREGDYSIGSWADDYHHESYAVETEILEPIADELHEVIRPSIEEKPPSSIDIRPKPKSTGPRWLRKSNRWTCTASIQSRIADILQMANGADNLFMQQRTVPAHQQRFAKEFYDTAGSIDNRFKKKYRHPTQPSIDKILLEENDEYRVYRDDQGCARDVDGHIINVSKEDIRKLMEKASRDEHNYICLLEHASSFTQTKLVPEIYTKDEINEMFYGVFGAQ